MEIPKFIENMTTQPQKVDFTQAICSVKSGFLPVTKLETSLSFSDAQIFQAITQKPIAKLADTEINDIKPVIGYFYIACTGGEKNEFTEIILGQIFDSLINNFRNFTIQEIKLAFDLAVDGKLGELDCSKPSRSLVGKIMNLYTDYKQNFLIRHDFFKNTPQYQLNPQRDKEALKTFYNETKEATKDLISVSVKEITAYRLSYLYDNLTTFGVEFPVPSDEQIQAALHLAKEYIVFDRTRDKIERMQAVQKFEEGEVVLAIKTLATTWLKANNCLLFLKHHEYDSISTKIDN